MKHKKCPYCNGPNNKRASKQNIDYERTADFYLLDYGDETRLVVELEDDESSTVISYCPMCGRKLS
jgi:uncharacterized protein with PIN domain